MEPYGFVPEADCPVHDRYDPVGAISDVLNDVSGDEDTWCRILEEPYG